MVLCVFYFYKSNIPLSVLHNCNISSDCKSHWRHRSWEFAFAAEDYITAQSFEGYCFMIERMELMEALSSWNSGASLPSGTNSWLSHLHVRHSNLYCETVRPVEILQGSKRPVNHFRDLGAIQNWYMVRKSKLSALSWLTNLNAYEVGVGNII